MAGLSRKEKHWIRLLLAGKYGHRCASCGKGSSPSITLDIDHINGNPADDSVSNLRLLCRSCNTSAGIRRAQGIVSFLEREGEITSSDPTASLRTRVNYSLGSSEMQVNDLVETQFRSWVIATCLKFGEYPVEDLIDAGAETTGASINAVRNYLKKMVSSVGPLEKFRFSGGRGPLYVRIKGRFKEAILADKISTSEAASGILKE